MTVHRRLFHTLLTGTLATGLLALLAIPAHSQDKGVPRDKQIADLEQQIAELTKRIADLRQGEETTPGKTTATTPTPDWVKALAWRSIGPANRSGRIVDLAVNPSDPSMYWVATASGGLLKT